LNELNWEHLKPEHLNLRAIYIDEGQFFDNQLGEVLSAIEWLFHFHPEREKTLLIRVAGLDMDFRGEPFGPMPDIMARASRVRKHVAVCTVCGENNATQTQRLINTKPADWNEPIILVGGKQDYTARCSDHHEVPNKPLLKANDKSS